MCPRVRFLQVDAITVCEELRLEEQEARGFLYSPSASKRPPLQAKGMRLDVDGAVPPRLDTVSYYHTS